MEYVLSYGTLQDPKVQEKLIGRVLKSTADSLTGFDQAEITIDKTIYSILIPNGKNTLIIKGEVLEITADELVAFDEYEGKEYQRSLLALESGNKAWVYHQ